MSDAVVGGSSHWTSSTATRTALLVAASEGRRAGRLRWLGARAGTLPVAPSRRISSAWRCGAAVLRMPRRHAVHQVGQSCERDLRLRGGRASRQHRHTLRARVVQEGRPERRLADPGLAHEDACAGIGRPVDDRRKRGELGLTPDDPQLQFVCARSRRSGSPRAMWALGPILAYPATVSHVTTGDFGVGSWIERRAGSRRTDRP